MENHSGKPKADLEILTVAVYPRIGGMTGWIDQIARGLAGRGWKVRLFGISDRWEADSSVPYERVHAVTSPPSGSLSAPLDKWRRWKLTGFFFQEWVKNHPAPLLRLSDCTPGVLDLARRLTEIDGAPWVVLSGGDVFAETAQQWFSGWLHRGIRRNLNSSRRILVDGPDLLKALVDRGIRIDLLAVHYHGVELCERVETGRYFPERTDETALRLVWHGRAAYHHGPLRFVEIARRVEGAEARLCGDGPESEAMAQRLAEIGKSQWRLGYLSEDEKRSLLTEADCGVYPLRDMAGMPKVLLESMAAGLCTLTYPTGAANELIVHGENGFICQDEDEMVSTLHRLKDEAGTRKRVGRAARETVAENWSLTAKLDELERLLRELMDR